MYICYYLAGDVFVRALTRSVATWEVGTEVGVRSTDCVAGVNDEGDSIFICPQCHTRPTAPPPRSVHTPRYQSLLAPPNRCWNWHRNFTYYIEILKLTTEPQSRLQYSHLTFWEIGQIAPISPRLLTNSVDWGHNVVFGADLSNVKEMISRQLWTYNTVLGARSKLRLLTKGGRLSSSNHAFSSYLARQTRILSSPGLLWGSHHSNVIH